MLQVPPSLHFSTAQIKDNYSQVINDKGFLTFIKNSVIVTGISTLIALGLAGGHELRALNPREHTPLSGLVDDGNREVITLGQRPNVVRARCAGSERSRADPGCRAKESATGSWRTGRARSTRLDR